MRKTKIVCTVGPSSESLPVVKQLILAGMNVARMNFAHGDFVEHGNRMQTIRQACKDLGASVAIMIDIKGPEIRIGKLKEDAYELVQGEQLTLTTEEIIGDRARISVTYKQLPQDVHIGSRILIDDGNIGLTVMDIQGTEIKCRIDNASIIKGRKGVNVPGVRTSLPGVTEKDVQNIKFGIEQGVDIIAASFVRKAGDVMQIRRILEELGASHIQIIAKIENEEGVENLDAILAASDGIMVARGDLGVEIPVEEVPLLQKQMISRCNIAGKPVITATHMLDSMQHNPRPTRAEASDVANAIFDGTDAVMLSGETAAGNYPVESVQMMSRIAERAEDTLEYREIFAKQSAAQRTTVTEAISQAVANSAFELNAKAIITATESGYTARMVAKYRPRCPIIAVTPTEQVMRRLALVWGVIPVQGEVVASTDAMFHMAIERSKSTGLLFPEDLVIITAGIPAGRSGTTNLIKVRHVGE